MKPKNGHYLVALLPEFAYLEELGMPHGSLIYLQGRYVCKVCFKKSKLVCSEELLMDMPAFTGLNVMVPWTFTLTHLTIVHK